VKIIFTNEKWVGEVMFGRVKNTGIRDFYDFCCPDTAMIDNRKSPGFNGVR